MSDSQPSETNLLKASRDGRLDIVKRCIKAKINVNCTAIDQCTPFFWAASKGLTGICEYLLQQGADLKLRNVIGHSPLTGACLAGHTQTAQWLLSQGCDVAEADYKGFSCLHCASQGGHLEIVKVLLANNAEVNARNKEGANDYIEVISLDLAMSLRDDGVLLSTEKGKIRFNRETITLCLKEYLNIAKALETVDEDGEVNYRIKLNDRGLYGTVDTGCPFFNLRYWWFAPSVKKELPTKRGIIVHRVHLNCKDKLENCAEMIKDGNCEKYKMYMSAKCTLSCQVCQLPKVRDEADKWLQVIFQKAFLRSMPDFVDYQGAAGAMIRLQRTYSLDTQDIIDGRIHGYKSFKGLSGEDVFFIGYTASSDEWGYAAQWLKKAKVLNNDSQTQFNISVQLGFVYLQMGDYYKANESLTVALKQHPLDPHNLTCYDRDDDCPGLAFDEKCQDKGVPEKCPFSCEVCWSIAPETFMGEHELSDLLYSFLNKTKSIKKFNSIITEDSTLRSNLATDEWKPEYEELCRGEGTRHYSNAFCHYRPVGPAWNCYKEEILTLNPRISQVYDVISDYEADYLRTVVKSKMRRSLVGAVLKTTDTRVSDVGWLHDEDYALVKKLSERIEMITGLEVTSEDPYTEVMNRTSSDAFQAVNYGIGGQYEPHLDYFKGDKDLNGTFMGDVVEASGDRMVTFLLYLTDVKAGGATVYPRVKVHVPPVKNAAAFWYNARLSGKYDPLTLHAGCPVLLGEKWVCNKWVREHRNDFNRRCGLTKNARNKK